MNILKIMLLEQRGRLARLIGAMLDQEPTAGDEMRGGGIDDAGELLEARRAADQGFRGLRPQGGRAQDPRRRYTADSRG